MAFIHLCEEHLSVKPALKPNGCRRLGKVRTGATQPRRLLVSLNSEASVQDLLIVAKELRSSDDDYIARSSFINPNLSPAAAKLAFERRQRQCNAKERESQRVSAATNVISNSNTANITRSTPLNNSGISQTSDLEVLNYNGCKQIKNKLFTTELHSVYAGNSQESMSVITRSD